METGRPRTLENSGAVVHKSFNIRLDEQDKYETILLWCNKRKKSMNSLIKTLLFDYFYPKVIGKKDKQVEKDTDASAQLE
jgi:hypothetical protein